MVEVVGSRGNVCPGVACVLIFLNCHALKWSLISFNFLKS